MTDTQQALIEALRAVLAYELEGAKLRGYSDCTCINRSRESERAYETGRCPHQKARVALARAEQEAKHE